MGNLQFPAFFLVLLSTVVVQITEEVIHMGMFPKVADYSFYSCRNKMLEMVTKPGGLLEAELNSNKMFKNMWQGNKACDKAITGGTPEHMIALQSFVENEEFRKTFENELLLTKSTGSSTYQDGFPFKSLFFLLTDTLNLLEKNCHMVHAGFEEEYSAKEGEKVRFASFIPAKSKYSDATEDAQLSEGAIIGTVFNINSCFAINLENMCPSEDMDLLILPTEVFTVESIRLVNDNNNKYKEISLKHSHIHSSSNCTGITMSGPITEESKESSSSSLSSSFMNVMSSLFMAYFYMLTL